MANPTLLKTPIASGGDKNTIPETTGSTTGLLSQEKGWQQINSLPINAGGIAPSRLDFNGVFNLLSNILFYAQKGWQWEFDETQNYFAGCTVKDTADGKTYVCIADVSASTTHPSSDTTHWELSDLATKDDLANYLPLAGGTMTGNIGTNANADFYVGSPSYGGFVRINGKNHVRSGRIALYADDGTLQARLEILSDGQLKLYAQGVDGANVLTDANGGYLPLSGGTMTGTSIKRNVDDSLLTFLGGKGEGATGYGASLQLFGPTHSALAGRFRLFAESQGEGALLDGQSNGVLTWGGNDLAGASIVAKSLGTTGYIKYANGLIIQWGESTNVATVQFPITFPNACSQVMVTIDHGSSDYSYANVIAKTTSSFTLYTYASSITQSYIAVGY